MDNIADKFKGPMDVGLKVSLGIAGAFVGAAAIVTPNKKQTEQAALDLFDRPVARLTPQERKTAQFQAGYANWKSFWETKFYPMTRQLPGAQNPVLNPYRGLEPLGGQEEED